VTTLAYTTLYQSRHANSCTCMCNRQMAPLLVIRQLANCWQLENPRRGIWSLHVVCAKFNYDRLHVDKVLGNWKSDNNKNKKCNIRSNLGPYPGPRIILLRSFCSGWSKLWVIQHKWPRFLVWPSWIDLLRRFKTATLWHEEKLIHRRKLVKNIGGALCEGSRAGIFRPTTIRY